MTTNHSPILMPSNQANAISLIIFVGALFEKHYQDERRKFRMPQYTAPTFASWQREDTDHSPSPSLPDPLVHCKVFARRKLDECRVIDVYRA
jgi:hypothetical protein